MAPSESGAGQNWPRFELVRITSPVAIPPGVATQLASPGVPRALIGYEYRALTEAVMVTSSAIDDLVCFGVCGVEGGICIEAETGAVVHIPDPVASAVRRVNRNLDSFTACVRAVIARFPFYGEDCELEQREEIARELREILLGIDEVTLSHNGFWETFLDDVTIGDYATELIVAIED